MIHQEKERGKTIIWIGEGGEGAGAAERKKAVFVPRDKPDVERKGVSKEKTKTHKGPAFERTFINIT